MDNCMDILGGTSPQECTASERTGMTAAEATKIIQQIDALASGELQSTGACPGGPVVIGLQPGDEPLAEKLLAEYGKKVSITISFIAYTGSPVRSPTCGQVAAPAPMPAGLHLSLRLKQTVVRPGADFEGSVVISESGPGVFDMDTGEPLVAVVVRPGTRRVVGVYSGGIGGVGYALRLTAGKTGTIQVLGGTARCDGGMGTALPPGRYQVVVQVFPEGQVHTPNYLTPPVTLEVSAA
jgi:hypothetical protein